jgi:hypothetical protein
LCSRRNKQPGGTAGKSVNIRSSRKFIGGEILAVDDENNFSDCLTNSKEIVHNLASALLTTNSDANEARRESAALHVL